MLYMLIPIIFSCGMFFLLDDIRKTIESIPVLGMSPHSFEDFIRMQAERTIFGLGKMSILFITLFSSLLILPLKQNRMAKKEEH